MTDLTPLLAAYRAEYTDAPDIQTVRSRIAKLAKSNREILFIVCQAVFNNQLEAEIQKAIADMYAPEPTREQLIETGIWFIDQMLDKEGKSNA